MPTTPITHCREAAWPQSLSDTRFASRLSKQMDGCAIGIIGLADDLGIAMNNGRVGAAEGPSAFRNAISSMGSANPPGFEWPRIFDAGDVIPGGSLEETHARVTEATSALLTNGLVPVGIGGGHDLTFPFVRATANAFGTLVGIYCDPHLDVREEPGSGMPFRKLIEGGHARELHLHGFDPFAATSDHKRWFDAHGGRVDAFGPDEAWPAGELFVSIDLDVFDQAYAPGVSAMNPCGWTPGVGAAWARAAGACERVRCFDIMELSPKNDDRDRTAKLAARLFLEFCRGFCERRADA